jgi:hypothetical protein
LSWGFSSARLVFPAVVFFCVGCLRERPLGAGRARARVCVQSGRAGRARGGRGTIKGSRAGKDGGRPLSATAREGKSVEPLHPSTRPPHHPPAPATILSARAPTSPLSYDSIRARPPHLDSTPRARAPARPLWARQTHPPPAHTQLEQRKGSNTHPEGQLPPPPFPAFEAQSGGARVEGASRESPLPLCCFVVPRARPPRDRSSTGPRPSGRAS